MFRAGILSAQQDRLQASINNSKCLMDSLAEEEESFFSSALPDLLSLHKQYNSRKDEILKTQHQLRGRYSGLQSEILAMKLKAAEAAERVRSAYARFQEHRDEVAKLRKEKSDMEREETCE
uniref:Uncharacterized protein n=1 Tax=Chromera velia CCMP2878 TaxID=1169474 RepID=A0A0G4IB20_9ALVE|eukprot:Cvel_12613.t1-p1 / transcript=Cvel_12613.t1 / gene=Cvel_12613 / organism=Chromera_velia_CCMP2878 / gene_product=hypothetical protein / transcript_product=hypothetical protein / location=Cvel_scaffold832:53345-53704(+) / protein_length=120 / sequence_SO=supercontig / SO=protein_coding / is_pseudo=false